MSNTTYAVWDTVNCEFMDRVFSTKESCVQAIARELRDMFSRPEEVENLTDYEVFLDYNEGQYKIYMEL